MRRGREAGLTFLELLIVVAVLLPVLFSVLGTSTMVGNAIDTSDNSAEVSEVLRKTALRLTNYFRSGILSTCRIRATPADVAAAQAEADAALLIDPTDIRYVPVVGEWISPFELDPRDNLRFRYSDGALSLNAKARSPVHVLGVELDRGETANGADDDGDGFVDEGMLVLGIQGRRAVLATQVEQATFMFDKRIIEFTLRCARRDRQGRVHRESLRQRVYMRNN